MDEEEFKDFVEGILAWTYGNPLNSSVQKHCKEKLSQWMTEKEIKKLSKEYEKEY